MAGERYSRQSLHVLEIRAGDWVEIYLSNSWWRFTARTTPANSQEFALFKGATQGATVRGTALEFFVCVRNFLAEKNLPYRVSEALVESLGTTLMTVEATFYSSATDFLPLRRGPNSLNVFLEHERLDAITPIFLSASPTPATIFGSANGAIDLYARRSGFNNPSAVYTYQWDDGPTTEDRTGLVAGTYRVLVRDNLGASASLAVLVTQDARLTVVVDRQDNHVRLLVSGGLIPYTYAWNDGSTAAERPNLANGNYTCLITDARGVTTEIELTIAPIQFFFSRNPITLALDAGDDYRTNPATKPRLSFLCEVWIELAYLSNEFVLVGAPLEQPADRDGRTVFQVEELLDAFLDYHLPAVGQAQVSLAGPVFRRFYLKHAEVFGEPPVRAASSTETQFYVLLGGLSAYESATRTYQNSYRPAVKPFLTWQPDHKLVFADQPEFLYYLSEAANDSSFALRCEVLYSDGSARLLPRPALSSGVRRHEVYCVPVGWQQLGLQDEAERFIVSWQVWVASEQDVVLSERRTYVLDRRPVAPRRYLLYANSLAGMDTLCVTGEAQLDADVTGEEVERVAGASYDVLRGDKLVLERSLRPVLKLASGLRAHSREWLASLQDLLLSRRVLLLNGPRWLPGVVKAKTTTILKEGERLQTLELDFQLPRERSYTPRLPVLPAGVPVPPVTRQDLLLP